MVINRLLGLNGVTADSARLDDLEGDAAYLAGLAAQMRGDGGLVSGSSVFR